MKLLKSMGLSLLTISLIGCGAIQRSQEAAEFEKNPAPQSGSSVLVVPVGSVEAENVSAKGGMAFGLIGALVELAATANSSADRGKKANAAMVEAKIEEYLAKQVATKLAESCGLKTDVYKEVLAKNDKEWVKKRVPIDSGTLNNPKRKVAYVVEAGTTRLAIIDGLAVTKLCITGAAKVFDAPAGNLLNKVTVSNGGMTCNHSLSHYSDDDPEKFNELKTVTKTALDEVATELAVGVCKKKVD